jgi:GntR family transcriptional regulator / MocR family aminotransferase
MSILDNVGFKSAVATPIYQQLYDHLRASILDGRLKKGAKIPSTRLLAAELGVSRNTVLNAYDQLIAEGYIESVEGKGTFVTQVLPEQHLSTAPYVHRQNGKAIAPSLRLSKRAEALLATPVLPYDYDNYTFRTGMPALDAFPYELWAKAVAREAHRLHPGSLMSQGTLGYRPLREAIANHVTVARQVRCTADQVIVVAGAQGALDLAARVLVNPGEKVWIEDPGYPGAQGALLAEGAHIIPIPVDDEGLMVEVGLERAPDARMAYLTPSHQFPLGVSLSLARRLLLLNWANRAGSYILEDDYDSEYRFTGRPLASLQGLDENNRTIYIGTFSKVMFSALRLGYLIVPEALVDAFRAMRRYVDGHPPGLEQRALAAFMMDGHFARHIRRMRVLYAERRQALLKAAQNLPLEIVAPDTGMHLVGWLPDDIDDGVAVRQAAKHHVHVLSISSLALSTPCRNGLVLGYAAVNEREIQEGVERLAAALKESRDR